MEQHTVTLSSQIRQAFADGGRLSKAIAGFRARDAQTLMADAVGQAISDKQTLVVEAGTGTGKTYAYLVPALLSGKKVIVSTGTKNLQEQLYLRDLPRVLSALAQPVATALLKGRSNYLCLFR
ncbi:MAG TPA: ATP-dependent helicase, partial [Rheinheimera sp.]|nr:ATP-dependent helicase [Rheinheimera sp.]